ncbi:MAG: glutamate synthase large chain [Blastocatellia bacterium]|nr:glutamate synthase large chain [Blastocatellia bacterium]
MQAINEKFDGLFVTGVIPGRGITGNMIKGNSNNPGPIDSHCLETPVNRLRGWSHDESEHDSCAIIANVKKDGRASHGNVKRTLEALARMGHRTGEIEGEGDGAGLQTDVPREIWARRVDSVGLRRTLAGRAHFTVAHLMLPADKVAEYPGIKNRALELFAEHSLEVLVAEPANTRPQTLGPLARAALPEFWQVAALPCTARGLEDSDIFRLQQRLEKELPLHVASLSQNSVVYKVRGDAESLRRYFPELNHPDFKSAITLGHGRYSTNTDSRPERAQMFSTLGHNGEINSIDRLGREAVSLGFQLPSKASDSQVLDRITESFMFRYGLSLMESLEIAFPPVWSEIAGFDKELQELYRYWRRAFGALAQGPAAIIARQGDEVVFSSDALGLRPLWCGETEKEFFASSEKGVVPLEQMVRDPRPLAPGEKMGFLLKRGEGVEVFEYYELQRRSLDAVKAKIDLKALNARTHWIQKSNVDASEPLEANQPSPGIEEKLLIAHGWNKIDDDDITEIGLTGKEPISGLGWDGPLAALSKQRKNVSDYFHERVAVVTNPAIDREREADHFSTRVFLGARPSLFEPKTVEQIELKSPILLGGVKPEFDREAYREVLRQTGLRALDEVLAFCGNPNSGDVLEGGLLRATIGISYDINENLEKALDRIEDEAVRQVRDSHVSVLLLEDTSAFLNNQPGIDPHLALAAVDTRLRAERDEAGVSLRRHTSLILSSAALRNVHDIALALGNGADAINPYAIFEVACRGAVSVEDRTSRLSNCVTALTVGIEKVLSTMGIHELDGYGRLFASVGLAPDVAEYFGVANYCGSDIAGVSLQSLDLESRARLSFVNGDTASEGLKRRDARLPGEFREQPSIWNVVGRVARREQPYENFVARLREIEQTKPVSLRQLLDIRVGIDETVSSEADEQVDTSCGRHSSPFYFSAMSFGSQGETSFRAYAEAAKQLDIICVNGEGGEIPDMLGRYRHHRGQQVASGRFGVNARLLNSCDLLEIKIGQGAKPGEGGLLPGFKVTAAIAETRHTPVGVDLISPSNNHDIYSIEDLEQVIEELKTINPSARISVKIPSVSHLGPIATGIAKAHADIIAISGYDGGTGAARKHSLRHTGLPVEIGLREAHRALVRSGLRNRVELWADGGVKSGADVVKLMMLGADRVGFGTMAMAAIGCTSCRECNTGTCHVGITSQLKSAEEALSAGQKHFVPREYEKAVDNLVTFFSEVNREIRRETKRAGLSTTADLVGRTDLLEQARGLDRLDLSELLIPTEACETCASNLEPSVGRARRSLTSLTRTISLTVLEVAKSGKAIVHFDDNHVSSSDRALGTHMAGTVIRGRHYSDYRDSESPIHNLKHTVLNFREGSVTGNGLGAFSTAGIDILVQGGVQDGAAKGCSGGRIVILKGLNHDGVLIDGSVGKCFAYGAQAGVLIVQGDADSRAGIRLSGADVIIAGRLRGPLRDELGQLAARANIKGFAFEYQTSGRGLVLGDPGPWLCSGMTGGVVYLLLNEELGLNKAAIERRLAKGAMVRVDSVDESDGQNLHDLLASYKGALIEGQQHAEAEAVQLLFQSWRERFVKVVPARTKKSPPIVVESVKVEDQKREDSTLSLELVH